MGSVHRPEADITPKEEIFSPTFVHIPAPREKKGRDRQQCLIFFVPGNPGLCQYYKQFFLHLRGLLQPTEDKFPVSFHFHCRNLQGFSEHDHEPFGKNGSAVFTVEDQIQYLERCLTQFENAGWTKDEDHGYDLRFDEIILMGHSLGAYIAIELFHRWMHNRASSASPPAGATLRAGILLFPTVTHIARSPSGKKLELIRKTPFLRTHASGIATGFVRLFPLWLLYQIIHLLLGFPPEPARVTAEWLASRDGIRQAIEMGKDEMATIGEEKWSDELWEITGGADAAGKGTEAGDAPKFCFLFGKNDHWVANDVREEFIRRREATGKRARTRIMIDETGIPHSFCIHHSEQVAEKVQIWVDEIVRSRFP